MKRRIIGILLILMTVILTTSCQQKTDEQTGLEEVSVATDYQQFAYEELKKKAVVIATIEIVDELSEQNSHVNYDEYATDGNYTIDFNAMRKAKIIDIYYGKGFSVGDTMEVLEPAAISEGKYLHSEGYEKLEKGGIYLVFLSNRTASGEYGLISASNSVVDLLSSPNPQYYEVKVKAIIEYVSNLPNEVKEKISQSKIATPESSKEKQLNEGKQIRIKDKNGDIVKSYFLKYGFSESSDVAYLTIDD